MNIDKKRPKIPAWDAALKLLAGRDFSASEMLVRLARRGYEEDEAESTVARLVQLGYVVETGNDRDKLCEMAREYLLKKKKTEITAGLCAHSKHFCCGKGLTPSW